MVLLYQPAILCYWFGLGACLRPLPDRQIFPPGKGVPGRLDRRLPVHLKPDKLSHGHFMGRYPIPMVKLPHDRTNCRRFRGSLVVVALGTLFRQTALPPEIPVLQFLRCCGIRLRPVPRVGALPGSVLRATVLHGCTFRHSDRVRHQYFPGLLLLASGLGSRLGPHYSPRPLSMGALSRLDNRHPRLRPRYPHGRSW